MIVKTIESIYDGVVGFMKPIITSIFFWCVVTAGVLTYIVTHA